MKKGFKNGKVPEIDSISSLTQKFYMEICDEQDKCAITRVFEDMQQNPEKYGRLSFGILTRERLKEVLDKGLRAEEYFEVQNQQIVDLKKQLAEKENTITALIEDSKASKELLKKEIKQLKKDLDEEANDGFLWEGKAREAWEEVDELKKQLAVTEKALKLAVADKCKFENAYISNVLGMPNGKLAVPKKEQWYLEQAEKELSNERQ